VVNAKSEPLSNVLVNLFRNGKPAGATVTTHGRFRFENVDTRGLQPGQLAVEVQYKDLKKKVPVDPKGLLIITMQQDAPPFRVTYFDIEGPAIDFLLKGELDPAWEQRLGGQPFIVPTNVFKEMQSLVERFAEPLAVGGEGGMTLEVVSSANKTPRALDEFAERHAGNPVFVGSPESLFFHIEPTHFPPRGQETHTP